MKIKLSDLKPRQHYSMTNWNIIFLFQSVLENGITTPFLINSDHLIFDGNRRFAIAKFLKIDEVECIIKDDICAEDFDVLSSHEYIVTDEKDYKRAKEYLTKRGIDVPSPFCFICRSKPSTNLFKVITKNIFNEVITKNSEKTVPVCDDCHKLINPTALVIGAMMINQFKNEK